MFTIKIFHYYSPDTEKLDLILKNQKTIMALIDDLNTKVDELQSALDAEQEAIKAAIEALNAQVAELTALLSTGATAEQIQGVITKIEAIKTDLEGTV